MPLEKCLSHVANAERVMKAKRSMKVMNAAMCGVGGVLALAGIALGASSLAGVSLGAWTGLAGALALCGGGGLMMVGVRRGVMDQLHAAVDQLTTLRREYDELQKVSASRTKMLEGMSHDLRTPLQAILGFSDVLREADTTPAVREQSGEAVVRNARLLLGTIDQMNEIAALAAGTWSSKMGNLRGCLQQLVTVVTAENAERKVEIKVVCMNAIPNASGEIVFSLMRGVEHAVRHAAAVASDGKLLITLTHVPDRNLVTITIDHKGQTAPYQIVEQLTQQEDAICFIVERPTGSGCLGLALAKQHLRANGGTIVAKLRDGSSTIIMDVPAIASVDAGSFTEVTVAAVECATTLNTRGVRVLVVDDAEDTLRLVSYHLTKADYNVETCTMGAAGLERALASKASANPFAVMLLDLNLPDMDGTSVATMLRQEGYRGTIVAFTATTVAETLEQCVKAGCDSWLTKPIDRAKLLEAVKRTAQRDAERRLAA